MTIRYIFAIFLMAFLFGNVNPILADEIIVGYRRHLADPALLVHNGRVYLYASNDDDYTIDKKSGYITSIVCVSSSDMKNWINHGAVFEVPRDASWAKRTWAPAVISRNAKIFLYFGNGDLGIGLVTSGNPIAPFKDPIGKGLISTETPDALPGENMWLFDPMTFIDDDGTIEQVIYTYNDVAQVGGLNPYTRVEAETMPSQKGVETEVCSKDDMNVTSLKDGDWIKINGLDFRSKGAEKFTANVIGNDSTVELRLGSETGKLIGALNTAAAKNNQDWKFLSCKIDEVAGKQDLFLVVKGTGTNSLKIDWWTLTAK